MHIQLFWLRRFHVFGIGQRSLGFSVRIEVKTGSTITVRFLLNIHVHFVISMLHVHFVVSMLHIWKVVIQNIHSTFHSIGVIQYNFINVVSLILSSLSSSGGLLVLLYAYISFWLGNHHLDSRLNVLN